MCSRKQDEFRDMLESLRDIPIVGDVRGAGYFYAIELVKDQGTKESFDDEESEDLLRGFLSGELYSRGLICRADDRGDPVVQLAPTLICDTEQFEEIEAVLRPVLTEAAERVRKSSGSAAAADPAGPIASRTVSRCSPSENCWGRWGSSPPPARAPRAGLFAGCTSPSSRTRPTWLNGGELLLTTGIQLKTPTAQRRFVRLLAGHGLAGLGVGTGFTHRRLPKALVTEADELDFPLFEVPYEMPFIAITEKAFARLVNEHYDVLTRGISLHESLERLVLEERGLPEILDSVAGAIGGEAVVLDGRGQAIARGSRRGGGGDRRALKALSAGVAEHTAEGQSGPFIPDGDGLADRVVAVPVPARGRGMPRAWLAVIGKPGPLGDFERLCARQAAIVVALELMRERIVRETERRLAGDVLTEALGGRLDPDELRGRLRPFGVGESTAMLVFEVADPAAAEPALEAALASAGCSALVATTAIAGRELLCAVVDAGDSDPVETARRVRTALSDEPGGVRVAASRPGLPDSLRRSFHEARCALEATAHMDGEAPEVASHRDLGSFTLLLALQDDEALRAYSDSLLAPIEDGEGEYGGELLRSLEAYIEQNGQWERAARRLYCHRHTLRYRIRRVEELTGRDLTRAHDRIELWLALRARELVK